MLSCRIRETLQLYASDPPSVPILLCWKLSGAYHLIDSLVMKPQKRPYFVYGEEFFFKLLFVYVSLFRWSVVWSVTHFFTPPFIVSKE